MYIGWRRRFSRFNFERRRVFFLCAITKSPYTFVANLRHPVPTPPTFGNCTDPLGVICRLTLRRGGIVLVQRSAVGGHKRFQLRNLGSQQLTHHGSASSFLIQEDFFIGVFS
ncbi:unnamed protein product [Pylaiella littoralis]